MMDNVHLEHPLGHEAPQIATCVYLYFKLPGGDKSKCTQWLESVKLCQEFLGHTSEHIISPKV
jgi:hypothetical protein